MGQLALVTGAAGGIGFCLAAELASRGYDILAVDRDAEGLAALESNLHSKHPTIHVKTKVLDLARLEAAQELYDACSADGQKIDVLINNVGFGKMGEHTELDPKVLQKMIVLNNVLLMELCLLFGQDMKTRRSGMILNVASLVGFSASPYFAAYSGSKASTLAFSTAFAQEMSDYGVRVSCLCPGTTDTNFLDTASVDSAASRGMRRFSSVWIATPDVVAKSGVDGLLKGKIVNVPTAFLKVQSIVLDVMPASFVSGFVKRKIQKANAKEEIS